jgi:two-component system phosphate regulon sensor histidine kinase PhoR
VDSSNSWLLSRLGSRLLTAGGGALAGWWLGRQFQHPAAFAFAGSASAALVFSAMDTLKGHMLLDWLRTPEADPPKVAGLWGEVAHRVKRVQILKDRQIEQEQARLAQFLSAIDASPNGVMMLDEGEQITWISSNAALHFGLDPKRDLMQRVTNLVRQPAFVRYLAAGEYGEAVKCAKAGGNGGHLLIQVQRYGDGNQKVVISQDITERERADTMRRDFVANVSHEIRTPLTVLSGFIETMGSLPLTEVERKRVIELMSQQAERMQTLVADLLILAQIEGSPMPPPDRWVRADRLMQRIESDARGLSRERHPMQFTLDEQGQYGEIAGVESEWLSAMGNLVSNAIRYTPEGGHIHVRWVNLPDGGGEFSVKDGGIGIAQEHIPRLTERFYRVDGSRSRETGGTGLGLSIVKHVVQRHGGELRISSEPGKGSTFTLTVPAARVRLST